MKPETREEARAFYRDTLSAMAQSGIPFMLGGAYALGLYTGVRRDTKDLDVFVLRRDCRRLLRYIRRSGFEVDMTHPHWLGKITHKDHLVDVIYSSGNGLCEVDEEWFRHAPQGLAFGVPVRIIPAEEMIWQKAFIMVRHRYDGADVAHLIRAWAKRMDWRRLLDRFGEHWPVLLSHLVLFGFIYPGERESVPGWVLEELTKHLRDKEERRASEKERPLCRGTLLSSLEFSPDVRQWGYSDARLLPAGKMTAREAARWDATF